MPELSAKMMSFIKLMKKSREHARRGFELLLARPGFEGYFDNLEEDGFFSPDRNPALVPAEEPGFFRVPYWEVLDYLKAVAKLSGERNDLELARKVMKVVRNVSEARELDGSIRDNYHTYRIFSEILGLVPCVVISSDDLNLIPGWMESRFDRGMVGHALDEGVLRRLLNSDSPADWDKAILILRHVTAVRWVKDRSFDEPAEKPETVMDDHWLKELIAHHPETLGTKVGKSSAEIFLERIREIFGRGNRDIASRYDRPAIEEHKQNHDWNGPFNRFVEGLRDVLLRWVEIDASAAKPFVAALLHDEVEIVRRIGIYVLGQSWDVLRDIYQTVLGPRLFHEGHLHELYGLLKTRFDNMGDGEKERTVEAIRQIPLPEGDEPEQRRKRIQRRWLSAIAGKGFTTADAWFGDLQSDKALGPLSIHPDFFSYMESAWGPGPTPYQVQDLLAFVESGPVVEKLNAFRQTDEWRGPSTAALVDTLVEAVGLAPESFLRLLPAFLGAKRPFQYGVIKGFYRLWESPGGNKPQIDWDRAWEIIVGFFENLIGNPEFWTEGITEKHGLTPTRDWIPPAVADFLEAGTKKDAKVYPDDLLPRTWALIGVLLDNAENAGEPGDDAMTQAINSSKGKAVEALINHALRVCRLSDRRSDSHAKEWAEMAPAFERELAQCENKNYEFSTLAGAYIANLDYMSHEWLEANVGRIFSLDFPANCFCALGGLAYAPTSRPVYALLAVSGVLDRALRQELKGKYTREKLIERIALAYLWGDEELDTPRFAYLFEACLVDDLKAASGFFWSVSNQELSITQVSRILNFWERCITLSRTTAEPPAHLLSGLSRLTCYLESIGEREREWLLAVAPYVHIDNNDESFIEELGRLAEQNSEVVSAVFGKMLDTYTPSWDFQDRIKSLIERLAVHGRKTDALSYAERLQHLQGMLQVFMKLHSG